MNIALIGATGGTGRIVLREALRRGHVLTVLVRNPERLDEADRLAARVVVGDATDVAAMTDALEGQDAVITTVSGRGAKVPETRSAAVALVAAARTVGPIRLVVTSSYGMVATRPLVIATVIRRVFATSFREQQEADDVIVSSGLDWTILRATRLTDSAETGLTRATTAPIRRGPFSLSRADLAQLLLDATERPTALRTIVNVSSGR